MLTEAQLYNLGIGDEIIVHGTCEDVYPNNDIRVSSYWTVAGETRTQSFLVKSSCVSLPPKKPKYDPCRPFRNGDIVRYVERDGRSCIDAPPVGATCCVCGGEDSVGIVSVEFTFGENEAPAVHEVPFYHLELITPIEELEPYHVLHNITNSYVIYKDKPETDNIVVNFTSTHPHAKEAAEAECAKLNAEHRKEREND